MFFELTRMIFGAFWKPKGHGHRVGTPWTGSGYYSRERVPIGDESAPFEMFSCSHPTIPLGGLVHV